VRNVGKKAATVNGGKDYIENSILPIVRELSLAPSEVAFDKLSDAAIKKWEKAGQFHFAQSFKDEYLSKKWKNWFIGSVPIKGMGITNNPLESLNLQVKLQVIHCLK
jgi:hypothetical protein